MQTKPKYYLNNKKLQYLLCIAKMTGINNGIQLFDEPIRNLKNNFALEKIADNFTRAYPIQEGTTKGAALGLTYDELTLPYSCKRIYDVKESINEEEKQLLMNVFVRFGAYSEKDLCRLLNEFKPLRNLPIWSYISIDELTDFLKGTGDIYNKNEIFLFCNENQVSAVIDDVVEEAATCQPVVSAVKDANIIATSTVSTSIEPVKGKNNIQEFVSILTNRLTTGLKETIAGKQYSLYIEAPPQILLKNINIISSKDNLQVMGNLKQINHGLYCYSFIGVASDIKVSIDI